MKQAHMLVMSSIFVMLFVSSFVSAYYFPSARTFTQDIIDTYVGVFEPILQALFGGFGWNGLYLFERFLLFILLLSLIYVILGNVEMFKKNTFVRWITAVIVPLIGIRFINFEWLTAVLLSYQVFAIAVTTAIPLLIFFFFVHGIGKEYPYIRKIFWVIFIGVYMGLWSTATSDGASSAYFWTFVAAILFLFLDSKIEYYLFKQEQKKAGQYWKYDVISRLRADIEFLNNNGAMDPDEKRKAIERKNKEIERISKMDVH